MQINIDSTAVCGVKSVDIHMTCKIIICDKKIACMYVDTTSKIKHHAIFYHILFLLLISLRF